MKRTSLKISDMDSANDTLIEVNVSDYSNLSEKEQRELYYYSIMKHHTKRLPRKQKKRYKQLKSKVINRTRFVTKKEFYEELPF